MLLAVLLAGVTSLVSAMPVSESQSHGSRAADTSLGKRILASSNCGLDMYQTVTNSRAMHNLMFLTGNTEDGDPEPPELTYGQPGKTIMISCTGKTGVWLSVHADVPVLTGYPGVPYITTDLGHQLDNTYHDCYGGTPPDDSGTGRAFQYWGQGYDLLMAGNAPCE